MVALQESDLAGYDCPTLEGGACNSESPVRIPVIAGILLLVPGLCLSTLGLLKMVLSQHA